MSGAPPPGPRLAGAFGRLAGGLLSPGSESDSPYKPFHAQLDSATASADAHVVRAALGVGDRWEVVFSDGDEWLTDTIAYERDPNGGDSPQDADAYELLRDAMHGTLETPLQRAGVSLGGGTFHLTRRVLFGRRGATLAGLVAYSVET